MRCIKCGCEIPEGEIFCTACSLSPAMEPAPKAHRKAPSKPVAPAPKPPKHVAPSRQAVKVEKKRVSKLLIPFLLALVLVIGLGTYVFLSYEDIARQERALQVRDADLLIKEKEFLATEEELAATNTLLEESKGEVYDLNQEVARLEEEARSWNSVASQSEFDLDTQKQELELLTQENTQLVEAVQTLEENMADLETEHQEMEETLKTTQTKANFMDQYVVFVNNEEDAEYYHSYDCSQFNKSNFFAYNTKLAESRGYSPCPYCKD